MTLEVHEYAERVLMGESLAEKLSSPDQILWSLTDMSYHGGEELKLPGRPDNLKFSDIQIKFPRRKSFVDPKQRASALHFFANHELLAIEMLALAILRFPCTCEEELRFKKTCIATLKDEQKHLSLYCQRMNELGLQFGDLPVNNFFWDKMAGVSSPEEFLSLLSLTFESANLDFSLYYEEVFLEVGDLKSAEIMREVYLDEISHVKTGVYWLNHWRKDEQLWDYYCRHLPDQVTPARAKGMTFHKESRLRANLDLDFVDKLEKYEDEFRVTKRKEWKK